VCAGATEISNVLGKLVNRTKQALHDKVWGAAHATTAPPRAPPRAAAPGAAAPAAEGAAESTQPAAEASSAAAAAEAAEIKYLNQLKELEAYKAAANEFDDLEGLEQSAGDQQVRCAFLPTAQSVALILCDSH
jgi:hypothetical protein